MLLDILHRQMDTDMLENVCELPLHVLLEDAFFEMIRNREGNPYTKNMLGYENLGSYLIGIRSIVDFCFVDFEML